MAKKLNLNSFSLDSESLHLGVLSNNAMCALFALERMVSEQTYPPFPLPPSPRARGFWRIKLHTALIAISYNVSFCENAVFVVGLQIVPGANQSRIGRKPHSSEGYQSRKFLRGMALLVPFFYEVSLNHSGSRRILSAFSWSALTQNGYHMQANQLIVIT